MARASKKSLNAKDYINRKVNNMRDAFENASDEETRKQLIETFRETTASDEYQENLKIVLEDAKMLRERLTPEQRTSKNLEISKKHYYWPNKIDAYLSDRELNEFEKKDLYDKLDFLYDKFWWWDKAYLKIISMLSCVDLVDSYIDPKRPEVILKYSAYLNSAQNRLAQMQKRMENVWSKKFKNLSLKSLGFPYHNIDNILFDISSHHRLSTEGFILVLLSNPSIFSDDINSIIDAVVYEIVMAWYIIEMNRSPSYNIIDTIPEWEKYFWEYGIKNFEKYHKVLANRILEFCWWKTYFLEKHIDAFTWLTGGEKSEILWKKSDK